MATDVHVGITLHAGALIEQAEITYNIDKYTLKGSNGVNARVNSKNPTKAFSVKGHGSLTAAVGSSISNVSQLSGISGGVQTIKSVKYTEHNDNWDEWSYEGEHDPSAELVS